MNLVDIPTMEHNSQVKQKDKQRHYLKHKSKVLEVKKKKERKREAPKHRYIKRGRGGRALKKETKEETDVFLEMNENKMTNNK